MASIKKKTLKKGCLITLGILFLLIIGILFGANWFLKEAFGPTYRTVEVELNNNRILVCDETYNADFAAVFYDVKFKLKSDNDKLIELGQTTFSTENWEKEIKLIEIEDWILLSVNNENSYYKLLLTNIKRKINSSRTFSPLELYNDTQWKAKYHKKPAWLYSGNSKIDSIKENNFYVNYEYRVGLNEPFEFYNQTIEYEMNIENGEFLTKTIFERKRIRK